MGKVIHRRKDLSTYDSPMAVVIPDDINEREMSAGFVICSVAVDREEEIVVPQGCRNTLDDYRANPIVLWDHNHDPHTNPPIGLSEDTGKRFTVRIFDDDRITARCFFHGKSFRNENLSLDIFNLVVKGAIRGASVGLIPLRVEPRQGGGKIYREWRLTEWSVTPLQSNQDCLRMCLSRGEVKTKSLSRSLQSHVPPAPVWANGFNPGEVMDLTTGRIRIEKTICRTMKDVSAWLKDKNFAPGVLKDAGAAWVVGYAPNSLKTEAKKSLGKGVTAMLVKAMPDDEDDEEEEKKDKPEEGGDKSEETTTEDDKTSDKSEEPGADDDKEGGEEEAPVESEDHSEKQGAKDLATIMLHFENMIDALPDILKRTDNDTVRKGIARIQADADKLMEHIKAVSEKAYPGLDLDSLKPDDNVVNEDMGEDPMESDSVEDVTDGNGTNVGTTPAPQPGEDDDAADDEELDDAFKSLEIAVGEMNAKAKGLRIIA